MEIVALGYIGIGSDKAEDWTAFATGLLGMQRIDRGAGRTAFRMDDRKQRLIVDASGADGADAMGWEVARASDLESLAARLDAANVDVHAGTPALAAMRHVARLIWFRDPAGNRVEVFCNPEIAPDPFVPARPITGFKTGPLGMGHVVLQVVDMAPLLAFYRDLLGFCVSDFARAPVPLHFFHVNGRHHSFAMVQTGRRGLHHFMVELLALDDVGQGYDLAQEDDAVAYTLGRHSNDWMTSFYARTPSDFFVEYGWGARVIDPATWEPHETFDGPSYWGHDRLFLPDGPRRRMREMTLDAARRGLRSGQGVACPWLDSVIARE